MLPIIKNLLQNKTYNTPAKNNFVLFLVLFLPTLVIFVFSYVYITNNLTKLTNTTFKQLATHYSVELNTKLSDLTLLGRDFAENVKFREAVSNKNWNESEQIIAIFQGTKHNDFIDIISLTDASGVVQATSSPERNFIGKDFSYRDWYKAVMATGKPYVSNVFRRIYEPKDNAIVVAVPIVGNNQVTDGILLFQINLDHFLTLVKDMPIGAGGYVYTVDQSGQVVASPEYSPQGKIVAQGNLDFIKKVLAGETGVAMTYDSEKKSEFLVAYHPSLYGWGVLVQQPKENAFYERTIVRRVIIALFVLVLVINILRVALVKRIISTCA